MILVALALIAVLIGMDLRPRARDQAAPKAADDAVEVSESKLDAAPLASEPAPSDSPPPQRAEVRIIKPGPAYPGSAYEEPVESAASQKETYSSERPSLQPVAAEVPRNDANDAPQPASPTKPAATHESRPKEPKGPLKLAGAGAVYPYPVYAKWFAKYREQVVGQHGADVRIEYDAVGSGGGIHQLLGAPSISAPPMSLCPTIKCQRPTAKFSTCRLCSAQGSPSTTSPA